MDHHRGGRPRHPDILTPAEWRVLEELRRGVTNAEIAARLGIGAETVKSHVSSMLAKLELRSREELAAWHPDGTRGRLRALFALPAVLGSFARPLMWVGAGVAALAGVATVVVALVVLEVALEGNGDPPVVSGPAATGTAPRSPTPTPQRQPSAAPVASPTPPAPAPTPSPATSPTATLAPTPVPSQSTSPASVPGRCAAPTDADCIIAVYEGAPDDYDQVTDIPADKLLEQTSDGRYHVERGKQYTVVTAAQLPATGGWTRFYLDRTETAGVPVSASRLIAPVGTTYTFTVADEVSAPGRYTYELKAAKPFPRPRPDGKPLIGDVVVSTMFQAPSFRYDSFDTTGAATSAGSYSLLMPDEDSEEEDATTPVTSYDELRRDATVLVVNTTDDGDYSQSSFYGEVEVGDLVELRQGRTCWTRYEVESAPEPAAGSSVRTFGVSWHMYSFVGCNTGLVDDDASTAFVWGPGDVELETHPEPLMYGAWELVASGYKGVVHPEGETDQVALNTDYPHSEVIAVAKQHRLWRNPTLPAAAGLTLHSVNMGYENIDGYVATYLSDTTSDWLMIQIRKLIGEHYRHWMGYQVELLDYETRWIDGRSAFVWYVNDLDARTDGGGLRAYDADTGVEYLVEGWGPNLTTIDELIEIARSLWSTQ